MLWLLDTNATLNFYASSCFVNLEIKKRMHLVLFSKGKWSKSWSLNKMFEVLRVRCEDRNHKVIFIYYWRSTYEYTLALNEYRLRGLLFSCIPKFFEHLLWYFINSELVLFTTEAGSAEECTWQQLRTIETGCRKIKPLFRNM